MDNCKLKNSMDLACRWITQTAQIRTDSIPENTANEKKYVYPSWKGCMKNEYNAASGKWDFMGPVWHTGQALKSLLMAYELYGTESCREAAEMAAEFIFSTQITDKHNPDYGLILAFEDLHDRTNTSAILESMDGLMMFAELKKSEDLWARIIAAGEFILNNTYDPVNAVFRDVYDHKEHKCMEPNPFKRKGDLPGRPLLDDSIFLKLYRKTSDRKFLDVQLAVSERLVKDQNPPGNWIDYGPCSIKMKCFHPRHTYWWGKPMIETYKYTNDKSFLDAAVTSAEFAANSMREDGGFFRGYYLNGKTDSFGHATSGSACAAIFWLELYNLTGECKWFEYAEKAIRFCMSVQFTNVSDQNLHGAILEKILPPDGSDRSPYYLRDLGTIFFVQAAAIYLKSFTSEGTEASFV